VPFFRLVPWPSTDIHGKFYGDRPRRNPPSGELNARGLAKYSDIVPIKGYISETVQDIGGKLVLVANRKSHMSFRLASKSVTVNDLERRRNGPYCCTEFGGFLSVLRKT